MNLKFGPHKSLYTSACNAALAAMGRARFLLYPWFIFFVTDQTQISLGQNDATYDAKRSCTENFVNILFYSWKKTIEFNCEKKTVVNSNIIILPVRIFYAYIHSQWLRLVVQSRISQWVQVKVQ